MSTYRQSFFLSHYPTRDPTRVFILEAILAITQHNLDIHCEHEIHSVITENGIYLSTIYTRAGTKVEILPSNLQ